MYCVLLYCIVCIAFVFASVALLHSLVCTHRFHKTWKYTLSLSHCGPWSSICLCLCLCLCCLLISPTLIISWSVLLIAALDPWSLLLALLSLDPWSCSLQCLSLSWYLGCCHLDYLLRSLMLFIAVLDHLIFDGGRWQTRAELEWIVNEGCGWRGELDTTRSALYTSEIQLRNTVEKYS